MNEWTIQFQYTRVLASISWISLNEITESDALEKGCILVPGLAHCLRLFYILSFVFVSPSFRARGSARIAAKYNASSDIVLRLSSVSKKLTRSLTSFTSVPTIKIFSADDSRVHGVFPIFISIPKTRRSFVNFAQD